MRRRKETEGEKKQKNEKKLFPLTVASNLSREMTSSGDSDRISRSLAQSPRRDARNTSASAGATRGSTTASLSF